MIHDLDVKKITIHDGISILVIKPLAKELSVPLTCILIYYLYKVV